jgi:hypothetical protein
MPAGLFMFIKGELLGMPDPGLTGTMPLPSPLPLGMGMNPDPACWEIMPPLFPSWPGIMPARHNVTRD